MLDLFSKSIYYPAGGTDLQVLLRLSDLSNTVISPNLSEYLTVIKYDEIFKRKCNHINTHYGFPILEYNGYELLDGDFIRRNKTIPYPPGLFTNHEMQQYSHAFEHYYKEENFVARYYFTRIIGSIRRELNWIVLNTEGLASLISLVNLTNEHPKILCTIQSGVLEYPNSLFVRLIDRLDLKTKIWIRGYWNNVDAYYYSNEPITNFPPYQFTIQDYGNWFSPMGELGVPNEENDYPNQLSKVRAFSKTEYQFPKTTEMEGPHNGRISIRQNDIQLINEDDYDFIITSSRLLSREPSDKIRYWNNYHKRHDSNHYPPLTFVESLSIVRNLISKENAKKIAITPVGFEDETLYLHQFLSEVDAPFQLDIYFKRPLDFISITAPDYI